MTKLSDEEWERLKNDKFVLEMVVCETKEKPLHAIINIQGDEECFLRYLASDECKTILSIIRS